MNPHFMKTKILNGYQIYTIRISFFLHFPLSIDAVLLIYFPQLSSWTLVSVLMTFFSVHFFFAVCWIYSLLSQTEWLILFNHTNKYLLVVLFCSLLISVFFFSFFTTQFEIVCFFLSFHLFVSRIAIKFQNNSLLRRKWNTEKISTFNQI